jgi:DnaK suppressor protein
MNKNKLDLFRTRLEDIRSELLGDVEKSNQNVRNGETGQIADISDDAARAYNRQIEGELGEQEWKKLKQVDAAIEKIDESEFGICGECEGTIPEARLEVVPYTEYCTQCLSDLEEKKKIININDLNPFQEN